MVVADSVNAVAAADTVVVVPVGHSSLELEVLVAVRVQVENKFQQVQEASFD